jgi:RNA polymerase sigma-70 factor (ECF subfamily)
MPELMRLSGDQEQVSGYAECVTVTDALARELLEDRDTFLAFLRARVRTRAYAEDIFQQALVKAVLHARDLRDRASTRAWFFRILRRAVADHHAQSEVRASRLAALAAEIDEATPREVAVCACSLDRLGGIRRDYAEILRRVDIDEQSIAEAAATLGITVNNATVRLHRARRALREDLVAFCGTDSTRACMECSCNAE